MLLFQEGRMAREQINLGIKDSNGKPMFTGTTQVYEP
jgi:hypothetical protein